MIGTRSGTVGSSSCSAAPDLWLASSSLEASVDDLQMVAVSEQNGHRLGAILFRAIWWQRKNIKHVRKRGIGAGFDGVHLSQLMYMHLCSLLVSHFSSVGAALYGEMAKSC